jgi:hypothetical protein
MSSSVDKSSGNQSLLSSQKIVYAGIAWAIVSLLFFLLFSTTAPGEESPLWYLIGTYVLELVPFLAAALLCYRNWRSPQIASGRNVWLAIGLGMLSYFIAGLLFGWWELYLGLDPDVSPADLFYIAFYVLLSWGMILAVLPRRLNLEIWQWVTVAVIAVAGIAFAVWVLVATPVAPQAASVTSVTPAATAIEETALDDSTSPSVSLAQAPAPGVASEEEALEKQPPSWALWLDRALTPLSRPVNFFYVVADVFLLIIASALLLAFWGGRFAQSWRMIAAATFSLYIADMWFKYAETSTVEYESGGLLEVFFVFSGVLFAIGAALEYDVSSRSRRSARRRT